jgi:hypothetical protein
VGADDEAIHHSRAPKIAVSARLTISTMTLEARACRSSMPLLRSSSRKRMPAQK